MKAFLTEICGHLVLLAFFVYPVTAQELTSPPFAGAPASPPTPTATPFEETIKPTFETQKLARTYVLDIPAPRGQITDRTGKPFAQDQLSYNLAIIYPTPLDFSDAQVLKFAREKIATAEKLLGRRLRISDESIERHYHNRGVLPFEIAQGLSSSDRDNLQKRLPANMILRPVYVRMYPNGNVAGQIIGYTGKTSRNPDGIIDNHELLWPETQGREGLEQTFDNMLVGQRGQYKLTFDKDGRKTSEKIAVSPVPGYNVITTIDLHLQETAEKILSAKAKRGAIVIMDPNTGDILTMASWPTFDPNLFVPSISDAKFKQLQDNPDIPLLPRAYRSAYPPGSTFKVAVGLAALETGSVGSEDLYDCVPAIQIGNVLFHNWKKGDRGQLNFVEALTESCDTWFYQVGIKTGAAPIIDWALKLGFGAKCGIPLRGEVPGRVPNDQYMKATHGRKLLNGDIANLSIGQGDLLVTPVQMAQAMSIIANGGKFYQTRLVQQVQTIDNQIVTAYQVREKKTLEATPETMKQIRTGMIEAVNGGAGTAHQASLDNIEVAGKTGTAQWGPKNKERTAAWFAGFVPADHPQYAFAALYESEIGQNAHGGSFAAPMVGEILREIYKDQLANGNHRRRTVTPKGTPPRAEPVEEDQSGD